MALCPSSMSPTKCIRAYSHRPLCRPEVVSDDPLRGTLSGFKLGYRVHLGSVKEVDALISCLTDQLLALLAAEALSHLHGTLKKYQTLPQYRGSLGLLHVPGDIRVMRALTKADGGDMELAFPETSVLCIVEGK